MAIRTVGVIGAGQMGSGIAQVCAAAGFDVRLNDVSADKIDAAVALIMGIAGAVEEVPEGDSMYEDEEVEFG